MTSEPSTDHDDAVEFSITGNTAKLTGPGRRAWLRSDSIVDLDDWR